MSNLQGFDEYFGTTEWRELGGEQRRQFRVILPLNWRNKVNKSIEQKTAEVLRNLIEEERQRRDGEGEH